MSDNKLIEKLIEEASNFLAHAKVMYDRDRDKDRAFKASIAAFGRLLEAVLLQQQQIEEMQEALKGTDEVVKGLVVDPSAVRKLFREVRKNG